MYKRFAQDCHKGGNPEPTRRMLTTFIIYSYIFIYIVGFILLTNLSFN
jgi:hypothetical protein